MSWRAPLKSESGASPAEHWRPRRRADCVDVPRPCPYVGCRYNLFLDVQGMPDGARGAASTPARGPKIRGNYPGTEPGDMVNSCALDVAEQGAKSCGEVGEIMGWSKQYTHLNIKRMLRRVRSRLPPLVSEALSLADERAGAENAPYRTLGLEEGTWQRKTHREDNR